MVTAASGIFEYRRFPQHYAAYSRYFRVLRLQGLLLQPIDFKIVFLMENVSSML